MKSLIKGLRGPFTGLKYLFDHPKLFVYVIIPFSITILIYAGLFYLMFHFGGNVMAWVTDTVLWEPSKDAGFWGSVSQWFFEALRWIIVVLLYVIMIILALLVFTTTANLVAAPFYDILSEKIEESLTGREFPPFNLRVFWRHTLRLLLTMSKRYAVLIVLIVFSIILQLIPVFGSLAGFLIAAFFALDEYFDYPFARWDIPVSARYRYFRKNFAHMLGFGAMAVGFLLIPVLGLIVIPGNVIYATMVFVEDFQKQQETLEEKKN